MNIEELFWWTLIVMASVLIGLTFELVMLQLAKWRRERAERELVERVQQVLDDKFLEQVRKIISADTTLEFREAAE